MNDIPLSPKLSFLRWKNVRWFLLGFVVALMLAGAVFYTNTSVKAAYDNGYNSGYAKGNTDGYSKGDSTGYAVGISDGKNNYNEATFYAYLNYYINNAIYKSRPDIKKSWDDVVSEVSNQYDAIKIMFPDATDDDIRSYFQNISDKKTDLYPLEYFKEKGFKYSGPN